MFKPNFSFPPSPLRRRLLNALSFPRRVYYSTYDHLKAGSVNDFACSGGRRDGVAGLGWAGLGWLAGWLCFPSLLEPSDWVEEKREGRKRFSTLLKKLFFPSSSYLILHVPFRGGLLVMECMARMRCDGGGGRGYL